MKIQDLEDVCHAGRTGDGPTCPGRGGDREVEGTGHENIGRRAGAPTPALRPKNESLEPRRDGQISKTNLSPTPYPVNARSGLRLGEIEGPLTAL